MVAATWYIYSYALIEICIPVFSAHVGYQATDILPIDLLTILVFLIVFKVLSPVEYKRDLTHAQEATRSQQQRIVQ